MSDAAVLPGADRAVVPREKLEGYILNPRHEIGRHKARVFAASLGIHQSDWAYLRGQLEEGVVVAPVGSWRETTWGRLYEVVVSVAGLNGQYRRVMTVWLVASQDEPPRFVTGYVLEPASGA